MDRFLGKLAKAGNLWAPGLCPALCRPERPGVLCRGLSGRQLHPVSVPAACAWQRTVLRYFAARLYGYRDALRLRWTVSMGNSMEPREGARILAGIRCLGSQNSHCVRSRTVLVVSREHGRVYW